MEEPWPLGCCLAQAYGFCSLDKQTALYLTVGFSLKKEGNPDTRYMDGLWVRQLFCYYDKCLGETNSRRRD
jgi:hypothetical protein